MKHRNKRTTDVENVNVDSPTTRARASSVTSEFMAGAPVTELDTVTVGMANVNRRFDLDDPSNGPSVIFRQVTPFASLIEGFSATENGWGDQDTGAATDTTVGNVADPLYPVTTMGHTMEKELWPSVKQLFSGGVGYRATVGFSEFIRYEACILKAYARVYQVLVLNKLAYHFDWSQVYPFTSAVPPVIIEMSENFRCTDIDIASFWAPTLRRFENKIIFPNLIHETKRMLNPMLSIDMQGRLLVPFNTNILAGPIAGDLLKVEVETLLNFIDAELNNVSSLMNSFIPFPLMELDPWSVNLGNLIDAHRENGWYNSNVLATSTFGDTGDPVVKQHMVMYTDDEDQPTQTGLFYTRQTQPTWSEIKMTSVWHHQAHLVDDRFRIMTNHLYGNIHIVDDAKDVVSYTGGEFTKADIGYRYVDFTNCRFANPDLEYGSMKPGVMGARFPYDPLVHLATLETLEIFAIPQLKLIAAQGAGSSLRQVREDLKSIAMS